MQSHSSLAMERTPGAAERAGVSVVWKFGRRPLSHRSFAWVPRIFPGSSFASAPADVISAYFQFSSNTSAVTARRALRDTALIYGPQRVRSRV